MSVARFTAVLTEKPGILTPGGIASVEALGTPNITGAAIILTPGGIASAEAFGQAQIQAGVAAQSMFLMF